ncbi:Adenylate kinase active site lid domain-containing protein [Plasmodiophora brassicae]|uniref:Adenylate kinase active site lid domain-containing protein n=1 Tax=Plasmodiophora brassicae TaxID=37360 RepID=A0A0G4J8Z1_PLABS|nr:hypothetical protein PBRA_003383 [Plasmodiophora brassicae]SPQ99733.1 unnamed protein product [Plasmodiophora brassicae]
MKPLRPRALVLLGAPGVGKGTYATLLSAWLGIEHISTGDAIRKLIRDGSPQGMVYKKYVDNGELLPNVMMKPLLAELLAGKKDVIMDGFPREASQVAMLDTVAEIRAVLLLTLRRDVLIEKVVKRRVCTGCSKIYNLADIKLGTMRMPPMPPKVAGVCDDCHGRVVQRNDDALAVVLKRLHDYDAKHEPIVEEYLKRDVVIPFELTGGKKEMWPDIQELFREKGLAPESEITAKL